MKLKDTKRKYDLFYVDDYVYFDNTVYKIVYSEGYIGYGYDIFKNKPTWEEDIVAINFEDDFEFIDRKRSTLPFNEVFFKGDKTVYFDEYSNRTEVNRFRQDEYSKEIAVLHVIAKSKDIDTSHLYLLDLEDKANKLKNEKNEYEKTIKDYYAEAFEKELENIDINNAKDKTLDAYLTYLLTVKKDFNIEDEPAIDGKDVNKFLEKHNTEKMENTADKDSLLKDLLDKLKKDSKK